VLVGSPIGSSRNGTGLRGSLLIPGRKRFWAEGMLGLVGDPADRQQAGGDCRRRRRSAGGPSLAVIACTAALHAAHQHRLIHPLLTGLRGVRALVPGYVPRAAACRHTHIFGRQLSGKTGLTR
jgi:hypothetical protein